MHSMWKAKGNTSHSWERFVCGLILSFIVSNSIAGIPEESLTSPDEHLSELSFSDYPDYSYPSAKRFYRARLVPYRKLSHATIVLTDDESSITGDYKIHPDLELNFSTSAVSPRSQQPQTLWTTPEKNLPSLSDERYLRNVIEKDFSSVRDDSKNGSLKIKARSKIISYMKKYGLHVILHNYTAAELKNSDDVSIIDGVNVVGVIRGRNWDKPQDGILLIGAHYDTVPDSHGVDDNGSGLAAMLEVARVLKGSHCKLKHTVMFVAFDMEEVGGLGSLYFVRDYLVPNVLKIKRGYFQGAYILDSVLNYDEGFNSQEIPPDFRKVLPSLSRYIALGGYRGNFYAMMSRWSLDAHLSTHLLKAWEQLDRPEYKLFHMGVSMGSRVPPVNILANHLNFLRSDHVMFWYHNTSTGPGSLNAVLITDTALFRGRMRTCYHTRCDNISFLTPKNLQFLKKLTDALIITVLDMTDGSCPHSFSASALRSNSSSPVHQMSAVTIMFSLLFLGCQFLKNSLDI